MATPIYITPMLHEALKAEGLDLPDECAGFTIEFPVDGLAQLVLRVNLTPEKFGQIGRAMNRIGNTPRVVEKLPARQPDTYKRG